MSRLGVLALAAGLTLPLAGLSDAAHAATAHNVQAAGAYPHGTNNCAPTTGHPDDDGCVSSAIEDDVDGGAGPAYKRDRYREVPPPPGWPR